MSEEQKTACELYAGGKIEAGTISAFIKPLATDRIDVLDHGFVRIIDSMGSDLSVSRAARVSYNAPPREQDKKLINYLWEHKHTSPFEAVTFTFEVKAPIFVFRQWHRHRTQSISEISSRYKELPEDFYLPDPSLIGVQSKDNKQGRDILGPDIARERKIEIEQMRSQCEAAFELYHKLLAEDWPRELARCVLPVNVYSHMFCTMNLLNLFKFLTLRCDSHAQYEIRVYANAMLELIRPIVPICVEAWENEQNSN